MSVIVFRDKKRIFQNENATTMIREIATWFISSNMAKSADRDGEFYSKRFFKYFVKQGRYQQPHTVSINDMVLDPSILKKNDHFEVSFYEGHACKKRVY
jgi:hypothetical protein